MKRKEEGGSSPASLDELVFMQYETQDNARLRGLYDVQEKVPVQVCVRRDQVAEMQMVYDIVSHTHSKALLEVKKTRMAKRQNLGIWYPADYKGPRVILPEQTHFDSKEMQVVADLVMMQQKKDTVPQVPQQQETEQLKAVPKAALDVELKAYYEPATRIVILTVEEQKEPLEAFKWAVHPISRVMMDNKTFLEPVMMDVLDQAAQGFASKFVKKPLGVCKCGEEQVNCPYSERVVQMVGDIDTRIPVVVLANECMSCRRTMLYSELNAMHLPMPDRVVELLKLMIDQAVSRHYSHRYPEIHFAVATGNDVKAASTLASLKALNKKVTLERVKIDFMEIQGTFAQVVQNKLSQVQNMTIVDDSGFMDNDGWPGVYTKDAWRHKSPSSWPQKLTVTSVVGVKIHGRKYLAAGYVDFESADKGIGGNVESIMLPFGSQGPALSQLTGKLKMLFSARYRAMRMLMRSLGLAF